MPEIEIAKEHVEETIHHHAGGHHGPPDRSTMQVALSSALIAVLAAVAALFAEHHANEAILENIKASDRWNYFQAKGIKANVLHTKVELLTALGKEVSPEDKEKLGEYKSEQKEIEESSRELEKHGQDHLDRHVVLSRSVTFLQISIALAAISVLTRKRWLWAGSLLVGIAGVVFFVRGIL